MSLRRRPDLTPAMLAANRRNAQKSTGPRSEQGKQRVRLNGLKHGLRCGSFRESLIKSGESTATVDRNFLFLTLYLQPQKRYEVHRIADFARLLWSVAHWGRCHEVRTERADRLVKKVATEFELQGLLNAGESRIAELERRSRSEPADLGLQRAEETELIQSPGEGELLSRTGPILLPGLVPPKLPAKPHLVRTRWGKTLRSKPECHVESVTSILARTIPKRAAGSRPCTAESKAAPVDKNEQTKAGISCGISNIHFRSSHPEATRSEARSRGREPNRVGCRKNRSVVIPFCIFLVLLSDKNCDFTKSIASSLRKQRPRDVTNFVTSSLRP